MSKLFESSELNGMTLKNRIVRSATFEAMADEDGVCKPELANLLTELARGEVCKPELANLLTELARGEVGLIITGFTYVSRVGKSRPGQTGIHKDELVSPFTELTRAVHKEGGTIVMQIMHAGCNSFTIPEGEYALGPSPIKMPQGCDVRAMTKVEISETVADFVNAAVRVKASGFDGVQLHGAHGYLLSQFLSPFYNKRTDEYGGSLEKRARIVLECLRGIRSTVGNDYPVLIKINSDDYLDGGLDNPKKRNCTLPGQLECTERKSRYPQCLSVE
jgi:2,4-dienoyl-CoA reductase-like NADH-dependent reductase (Old Yellow Enzyme family)